MIYPLTFTRALPIQPLILALGIEEGTLSDDGIAGDWEQAAVGADRREGRGRAKLTAEAAATRRQGGGEKGVQRGWGQS